MKTNASLERLLIEADGLLLPQKNILLTGSPFPMFRRLIVMTPDYPRKHFGDRRQNYCFLLQALDRSLS